MKYELLVTVFVLYQLSIYIFMRRWVDTRENRVMRLVEERKLHSAQPQDIAVMMHAQGRRKAILILVIIMIGLVFAMILGTGSSVEGFSWSSFLVGITIILALSWTPWGMVAEVYGIAMVLDNHSITRFSPWSKERTVRWSEVHSVTYSAFWAWFTVGTSEGTIHVTTVIVGLEKFAQAMVSHLPGDRIHVPEEVMSKAMRGPFRY